MKTFLIDTKRNLIQCSYEELASKLQDLKVRGVQYRVMEVNQ